MKLNLKNKKLLTTGLSVAIVAAASTGAVYFYKSNPKKSEAPTTTTEEQVQQNLEKKEETSNSTQNNSRESQASQPQPSQTTPPATSVNSNLDGVSLQGVLGSNDSISVSLYGSSGNYTVQRKTSENNWTNLVVNQSYSGAGGLGLNEEIPASETERVYRVYKVVNGQNIGPAEITVNRNLVVSKGGVSTFVRAQ